MDSRVVDREADDDAGDDGSSWVLATRERGLLKDLGPDATLAEVDAATGSCPVWTDDFTNLLAALR